MWWARVLGLAGIYYVVGQLSLLMAIPPGYAAAIWPAAGIAVAAVLYFGYGVWPGVWLGSFLANAPTTFDKHDPQAILLSVVLPMGIGMGASLQAIVAAVLVRRFVGFPNPLNRERDVLLLQVLSGPVSCLLSATAGVALLLWTGRIQGEETAFSWWTWWVGDTIGAFLVTPLLLLWMTRAEPDWPRRPLTVSVPLGILAALAVTLFVFIDTLERKRLRLAFDVQTETLTRALENRIEYSLANLHGMRGNYGSMPNADDQRKFTRTAQNMLTPRTTMQALAWLPRVLDADRAAFETLGRRAYDFGFAIRQTNGDGEFVPADRRAEYFPLLYRVPLPPRHNGLGFDLAAEPQRFAAMQRACDTGEPAATSPIRALEPKAVEKRIVVFLPIYRDGASPDQAVERRQALSGFVAAVLHMDDLVELAWHGFHNEGIEFWLFDDTNSSGRQLALYRGATPNKPDDWNPAAPTAPAVESQRTTTIEAAGRRWTLTFAQTPEYLAIHRSAHAWTVLAAGMLFTGLLGGVLVVVTGRASLIAGLVHERTLALAQTNQAMAREIAERKRLEQEVLEIAASEQRRIGQELHDGTGQELTGLCLLADNLADSLGDGAPAEAQRAGRIAQGLRQALGQVRTLSRGLIPVEVDAEGLMAALSELTKRISDLHVVRCRFTCVEPVRLEDNFVANQLYRIAQEATTNALKHGHAENIHVSLEAKGAYVALRIADDGVGLPASENGTEGMGLLIMRYRASQIGAELTICPGSTGGVVITCTLFRGSSHD